MLPNDPHPFPSSILAPSPVPTDTMPLVVLKFGGSSVSTRDRWDTIARIVAARREEGHRVLLVCSATKGTSDDLEALAQDGSDAVIAERLERIRLRHEALASDLGVPFGVLEPLFNALSQVTGELDGPADARTHAAIMSFGEHLSTRLGHAFLTHEGLGATWADSRVFLEAEAADHDEGRWLSATCASDATPDLEAHLRSLSPVVITQGFLARDNETGSIALLGRGGSDTSAAYLAARLGAARLEIWTDVPGLFSAHPGVVREARKLDSLTFDEARVAASLGARVLHPRCLEPARRAGLELQVRSTLAPTKKGTTISTAPVEPRIGAVVHRRGLRLIEMRRPTTWQPVGFLADVAAVFRDHQISMDLVSSSAGRILATIDTSASPTADHRMENLLSDLSQVCEPRMMGKAASVSLVGAGLSQVLDAVGGVLRAAHEADIAMTSTGSDDAHLSFVVAPDQADDLVQRLHGAVFPTPEASPQRQAVGR